MAPSTWTKKTSTKAIPSVVTNAARICKVVSTSPLELESAEELEEEEEDEDDFLEDEEEESDEDWK
jgi:hypothetical protein